MGFRDPGRARLRPSRLGELLAGRLALPELCKAIYCFIPLSVIDQEMEIDIRLCVDWETPDHHAERDDYEMAIDIRRCVD